jgi:O-antigen/teichoic acid export membrane protein
MGLARNTLLYLAPNVVSLLVSLALLPVTTAFLGAEEIGRIALLNAYGNLIVALAAAPFGYLGGAHYLGLAEEEKPAYVSTLIMGGAGLIALLLAFFGGAWLLLHRHVSYFENTSATEMLLVLGMAAGLASWSQTNTLLILESRARWIASFSIASTLVGAVVTTVGLFGLGGGITAVLLGSLCAMMVLAIGGLLGVWPHLRWRWNRRWSRELLHVGLLRAPQGLLDPLAAMAERWMVTRWVSLGALGLYAHSQSYRAAMATTLAALTKSLLPISLLEARQENGEFRQTHRIIRVAVLLLTLASLGMALFGRELIGLLTHGKFEAAAPFVTAWIIHFLVRYTGREETAILLTAECKVFLSVSSISTQLANLLILLLLIPPWGVWGIFAAALAEVFLLRVMLRWKTNRVRQCRFHDGPAIVGLLTALTALGAQVLFWDRPAIRAAVLTGLLGGYALTERTTIAALWRLVSDRLGRWMDRPSRPVDYPSQAA